MRLPLHRIRTLILMVIAMSAATIGDIFLAQAMQAIGEVHVTSLSQALDLGAHIFSTPKVWLALVLFAVFFFLWMTVLSYEDLSFALPLTALTYLMNAVLVGPFLGEVVTPLRWFGTILIGVGVALVTASGGEGHGHASEPPPAEGPATAAAAEA